MPSAAIGNDVVDLGDPVIARHHQNERFLARVCSQEERSRVATARDLWSLFAAKEAAYKALVKLGGAPGFGHRSLHVAPDLSSVTWANRCLSLRVTADGECVHAVAWSAGAQPLARVCRTENHGREGRDEGEEARAVLRELVATALGCGPGELEVVRDAVPGAWDGQGPPRVLRAGAPVDADVSLSHDGRFVAAAALVGIDRGRGARG